MSVPDVVTKRNDLFEDIESVVSQPAEPESFFGAPASSQHQRNPMCRCPNSYTINYPPFPRPQSVEIQTSGFLVDMLPVQQPPQPPPPPPHQSFTIHLPVLPFRPPPRVPRYMNPIHHRLWYQQQRMQELQRRRMANYRIVTRPGQFGHREHETGERRGCQVRPPNVQRGQIRQPPPAHTSTRTTTAHARPIRQNESLPTPTPPLQYVIILFFFFSTDCQA